MSKNFYHIVVGLILCSYELLSAGYAASASSPKAYLWHRVRGPEVEAALKPFHNWKIYALYAEIRSKKPVVILDHLPQSIPVIRLDRSCWQKDGFLKKLLPILAKLPEGEVQLDCDVPESKLEKYAVFLRTLKMQDRHHTFSVTLLPCHLKHAELKEVLDQAADAVLQLHALETPPDLPQEYKLFDAAAAEQTVRDMKRYLKPFKIALPSYAYTVHYTQDGRFRRLSSENEPPPIRGEFRRIVQPEWRDVVDFRRKHPELDVIWFRLPRKGDRLSLEAENLIRLQQGVLPRTEVEVIVKTEGLCTDVLWKNHGLLGRVPHQLKLGGRGEVFFFNGVTAVGECVPGVVPGEIQGMLPPPSETFLAAKIISWERKKK